MLVNQRQISVNKRQIKRGELKWATGKKIIIYKLFP